MSERTVQTPSAPAAIGPYVQAVRAGGFLFCSGQIALDPKSGALVPGGIGAETAQVCRNLAAVLAAAGCTPADVVKTTVYLVDLAEFGAMNGIYAETFGTTNPPARATVQVAALPRGARVEIDAIARLPGEAPGNR